MTTTTQTSIFPRIQQYIHDLSNTLNLSLIVLISSQISRKSSLPVHTQLKTDETSCLQQENSGIIKCLTRVFKFNFILVRGNDISYRPLGFFPLHCGIQPILAKRYRRRKQVYTAWISKILREKCDSLVRERLLFTTMNSNL